MAKKSAHLFKSNAYHNILKVKDKVPNYDIKRNLSRTESATEDIPWQNYKTIKMNSTYLEVVDRSFDVYGKVLVWILLVGLIPFFVIIFMHYFSFYEFFYKDIKESIIGVLGFTILGIIIYPIIFGALYSVYKKEFCSYSYRPIRFNRKNRKVYAFDDQGQVHIADWDKMVFIPEHMPTYLSDQKHEIQGFMLDDEDKIRYIVRFGIGYHIKTTLMQWEFVRRYMEEDPAQFVIDYDAFYQGKFEPEISHLTWCLDIDGKKESAVLSKEIIYLHNLDLQHWMSKPLFYLLYLFRRLMMVFAKVPYWPQWVNEECQVDENDPNIVTARKNLDIYTNLEELKKEYSSHPS